MQFVDKGFITDRQKTQWEDPRLLDPVIAGPVSKINCYLLAFVTALTNFLCSIFDKIFW